VFGLDAADARPAGPVLAAAAADIGALVPGILDAAEANIRPAEG